MLKIGAHMSTAFGFANVVVKSAEIGANAFQIFSHNPRSWKIKTFKDEEFNDFRNNMNEFSFDFENTLVHSGYLINLASFRDDSWEKSISAMIGEINIMLKLGIKYYNVHPGSHLGKGEDYAFDRIAKALDKVFEHFDNTDFMILLENVAQKGNNVGYKINHIGEIIKRSSYSSRIGLTYDTCHGFDSNYDITKKNGVIGLLDEIEEHIGIEKFKMIHLNDTKYPLGAKKDRHELIGLGHIGLKGFENFLSFDEITKRPLILETPGDDSVHANDIQTVLKIFSSLKK